MVQGELAFELFSKGDLTDRVQIAYDILKDGGWHTTIEFKNASNTCCPSADVGDLRKKLRDKGYTVETKYEGLSKDKHKIYSYQLVSK